MENDVVIEEKKVLDKILANKALIFILLGIMARIIMLFYYYYTHMLNPQKSWGDVQLNYSKPWRGYPMLTQVFILTFIFLSFGRIEIFAFWAFFWDLLTCLMFYFVLKSFNIDNKKYAFALFLLNPFWFLNNSFSLENCGYHITDSFFFFFFLLALIFYPKKEIYARYLFYVFLGLSMCIKYYTLPAVGLFLMKYLYEKNWKELKISIICLFPLLIIFLVIPIFYLEGYFQSAYGYSQLGAATPLYISIIPVLIIIILFCIFRLKKSDQFEIIIVSIIAMGALLFLNYPYLRWFQALIFYGVLKEREFFNLKLKLREFKRDIIVNNHLLTFVLSILAVFGSFLLILFIL